MTTDSSEATSLDDRALESADQAGRGAPEASTASLEREPKPGFSPAASACEPHRAWLEQELARGRNAMTVWRDLVDRFCFEGSYESVKRFARKLRGGSAVEARVTITTEPGEEGQVDYGMGPMVRDPASNKYRRTRLFVMTLGHSRKAVWLLRFESSSETWCRLHEEAFERLGGVPRVIVLDNLREGVIKPDIYDPTLNPLYRDMLTHYGTVGVPARVRDPDRKGKVERSVGFARNSPLKNQRLESLAEAQSYLDRWCERWADTRIHGTTKRQVAAAFADEKPHLRALPCQRFCYYQHGTRTVHLDGCVEVEAAYYGVPPGWIGRKVAVQWDILNVRLLDPATGLLLREHRRKPRGWRVVHPSDLPRRVPATTSSLLARAVAAGTSIGQVCLRIHEVEGEGGIRRILGVMSLVKKHGAATVDKACRTALELGHPNYRFVKKWLEKQSLVPISLLQVDPLIRQLHEYRDAVERITNQPPPTTTPTASTTP